jgi:hypothetical protein
LIKNEIFVNLKKVFIEYFSMQLLNQKIDSLNLITDEEKLKEIAKLRLSVESGSPDGNPDPTGLGSG